MGLDGKVYGVHTANNRSYGANAGRKREQLQEAILQLKGEGKIPWHRVLYIFAESYSTVTATDEDIKTRNLLAPIYVLHSTLFVSKIQEEKWLKESVAAARAAHPSTAHLQYLGASQ